MSVVVNPYNHQKAQLGVIETGLKTLKNEKHLMSDAEFSDMYNAVEQHHRDLRLAHLTGKAKDLMEQAEKDTKFYNILIKMLCEIKRLPSQKQKESLKKVRLWYVGNRHTLATGPRFGKYPQKAEDKVIDSNNSQTPSAKLRSSSGRLTAASGRQSNKENRGVPKSAKSTKSVKSGEFQQFVSQSRDENGTRDDLSTPRGYKGSEPASSRMSLSTDFMTNRFMMDLPASKLSWHMESPTKSMFDGGASTDWDGTEAELQRVAESSLSRPTFDGNFHIGQPSVPNSSPNIEDNSPRSLGSEGSGGNFSSNVDVGSTDMVDFHSDVRRGLSRGQTSAGSLRNGMSEDQSSTEVFGLQRKMVHSIASLVNPHAKLAESEAKRLEQEYREKQNSTPVRSASQLSRRAVGSAKSGGTDLTAHIPVLRTVNVSNDSKMDNIGAFNSFKYDHLYGQEILSKLNFVGRSGTALDVRYSAHNLGDMPEHHTREIIQLYTMHSRPNSEAIPTESQIHNQTLEDFYQTAENYYPTNLPKYGGISRIQSAPAQRVKSAKTVYNRGPGTNTTIQSTRKPATASTKVQKPQSGKLGKTVSENGYGISDKVKDKVEEEDEILYTASRPHSAVKLDTVVGLIDHVKDEMNFFKEKLAPAPMPGFRQPASTTVSNKPLSRPTSTASRASRKMRTRSPSPQGRPSTPTEAECLMMGDSAVPNETYKPYAFPARPHSATVSKAVDWRGKITPEATRIRSKTRFGGHTYVQKLKPSLRTAGAVSAGSRPKTAPMTMKEKWNVKDKECDKNERVAQAASNTVTQIDDKDMDRIMSIQHLVGTSDSRYGSMGSLFLDEDFLRSLNSRYNTSSSLNTTGTKEYISFIGPIGASPRSAPNESRAQSRHSARRPEINQIPEETTVREEDTATQEAEADEPLTTGQYETAINQTSSQDKIGGLQDQTQTPAREPAITARETAKDPSLSAEEPTLSGKDPVLPTTVEATEPAVSAKEPVVSAREAVTIQNESHGEDVHIEVTAIPASGKAPNLPTSLEEALKGLSKSEVWQYQPDIEQQNVDASEYFTLETTEGYDIGGEDSQEVPKGKNSEKSGHSRQLHKDHLQEHHIHHHHYNGTDLWSKSSVRPENYCFHCISDNMTTKVGRSAGRMPGGPQTPAGQVLRMSRRQSDLYKKSPPVRTPPSIPSPHHALGGRTPRQGQQYHTELEHHARKVKSPRHYMEQVVELRKDNCRSAPPGSRQENPDDIMGSMSVISLQIPSRAQTAPTGPPKMRVSDNLFSLPSHMEVDEKLEEELNDVGKVQADEASQQIGEQLTEPPPTAKRPVTKHSANTSQSIAHVGRPIAQVSQIPDPDEVAQHVSKQKEAKAAVDIQRIFRGYVCRNSYNELLWENRKKLEDQQMALNEREKEYRKHQGRKAKIYGRPPLDPALIEWAKEFKKIQVQNSEKRQEKMDNMAKEMLANQQKAKSKIEVIGPHVEIYDIYHPKDTGPSKRDMHKAAVKIQQHIRGFLVRRRFEKLRRKATFCGTTWDKIIKEYKHLLIRVQRWHGVEKPVTPFSLHEMYEYMDLRRRYESQFDKKSFGEELELCDLEPFFRECDLYPSKLEIEEGMDVTTQGQALKRNKGLNKQEAMNLVFYIYCPRATGLREKRPSTWMNPIIDGVEAKKLIGSENVEDAPLKPCANLVINSRKERKDKEDAEKARLLELERSKRGNSVDDDEEEEEEDKSGTKTDKKKISIVVGKGIVPKQTPVVKR